MGGLSYIATSRQCFTYTSKQNHKDCKILNDKFYGGFKGNSPHLFMNGEGVDRKV